jgi:hypothetical protein
MNSDGRFVSAAGKWVVVVAVSGLTAVLVCWLMFRTSLPARDRGAETRDRGAETPNRSADPRIVWTNNWAIINDPFPVSEPLASVRPIVPSTSLAFRAWISPMTLPYRR